VSGPPPISVVVPVRDGLAYLKDLYASLAGQTGRSFQGAAMPDGFERLHILDNGSGAATRRWLEATAGRDQRVLVEDAAGMTIYECWNRGFWQAKREAGRGRFHVAVLNSDVRLPAHALAQLSAALIARTDRGAAYPDFAAPWIDGPAEVAADPPCVETRGVWGSGGMLGFGFMLAGERIGWRPLVQDCTYQWWYGDNHLARSIELAGLKQVKVVGLPIWHAMEGTARDYDLSAEKAADAEHWRYVNRAPAPRVRRASMGDTTRPPARGTRVVRRWRPEP
jgi:glycosyltransferase involved in cell wall biosynthesis